MGAMTAPPLGPQRRNLNIWQLPALKMPVGSAPHFGQIGVRGYSQKQMFGCGNPSGVFSRKLPLPNDKWTSAFGRAKDSQFSAG